MIKFQGTTYGGGNVDSAPIFNVCGECPEKDQKRFNDSDFKRHMRDVHPDLLKTEDGKDWRTWWVQETIRIFKVGTVEPVYYTDPKAFKKLMQKAYGKKEKSNENNKV